MRGSHSKARRRSKYRRRGIRKRRIGTREQKPTILIVCEGEKTEPNYFRAFPVTSLDVQVVGTGFNTISLVKEAINLSRKRPFDQVWCVFDKDDFPKKDFNNAVQMMENQGKRFHCAYSNESFELWYILHFAYHIAASSRQDYCKLLSSRLQRKYQKNCRTMYNDLLDKQQDAIRNARKLLDRYSASTPPSDRNPSTTVQLLVEELNKHL